jgi:hypothetical protein
MPLSLRLPHAMLVAIYLGIALSGMCEKAESCTLTHERKAEQRGES